MVFQLSLSARLAKQVLGDAEVSRSLRGREREFTDHGLTKILVML